MVAYLRHKIQNERNTVAPDYLVYSYNFYELARGVIIALDEYLFGMNTNFTTEFIPLNKKNKKFLVTNLQLYSPFK